MAGMELLIDTVCKAGSQDPSTVKFAEEKIKEWELDPNFHKALLTISRNESLDVPIRWMSIIFFKNGVDKYWRRTVNRIFTEEDKVEMKKALISSFSEPVSQIYLQKAIVIGRISRTDLKTWPDLIPCLLQGVQCEDNTIQFNALLTLNHVIKNLVSKRLAADRRIFQQVSCGLLAFLLDLWRVYCEDCIKRLSINEVNGIDSSLRMSLLTLKVLRKLVIEGSNESVEVHSQALLKELTGKLQVLLQIRLQYLAVANISEKVEKLIVTAMKILLDSQNRHPVLFASVLEDSLNMAISYVFSCSEQNVLFETFLVRCANLIRGIIKSNACKSSRNRETDCKIADAIQKAEQIKNQIMTQDAVTRMCEQLVMKYFPLRQQDLNEWENDPESYLFAEAGESSDYLLLPSTENLFLCLHYEYRPIFTETLSRLVQSLNTSYNTSDPNCLLLREAVYFALGLASYELFGDLDFDQYFATNLLKELQDTSNGMKIIHRRVLWLIGRWVNVSFSKESRDVLYRVLIKFTDQKEDLVVRITAAKTLKDAVDDYQFESQDIAPYLKQLWENLFQLLMAVHECDTKMTILSAISMLIERTGSEMRPYTSTLCDYLPHLWADSVDHNMLRCVMLTTFARVVQALEAESMKLHHILLPIVQLSTDLKQAPHVYLLEDGLELWLTVIQNSSVLSENCLDIFPVVTILLEQTSEHFETCISIMESYLLLDAASVVKMHSASLVHVIDSLVGQMKDEGNVMLSQLVKLVLILLPQEGVIIFENTMIKAFKAIVEDEEYPRVLVSYLSLFGYVILQNSPRFQHLLQRCSKEMDEQPQDLAAKFIDVWLGKIDCIADDKPRKLSAMALVSLLPSNATFVNERFALILDCVVNVLYDDSQKSQDLQASGNEAGITNEGTNLEGERRAKLSLTDVVSSTQLLTFVKFKFEETRRSLGDERFHLLMGNLDPVVSKQLMSLIA